MLYEQEDSSAHAGNIIKCKPLKRKSFSGFAGKRMGICLGMCII